MAAIILPDRWMQQPQGSVAVKPEVVDLWGDCTNSYVSPDLLISSSANILSTPFDGERGRYFPANDSTEYLSAKNKVNFSGKWSASATIKTATLPGSSGVEWVLFSSGDGTATPYYYWTLNVLNTGAIKWLAYATVNTSVASAAGVIVAGKRQQVLVTYNEFDTGANDGGVKIYVDGAQVASGTSRTIVRTDAANTFNVAKRPGFGNGASFHGQINDVALARVAFPDTYARHITKTPWALLQPQKRVLYFDAPSFPVLSSLSVSNITSSGGRLTAST